MGALTEITEVARKNKRLSPKEMESMILKLCKDHWQGGYCLYFTREQSNKTHMTASDFFSFCLNSFDISRFLVQYYGYR